MKVWEIPRPFFVPQNVAHWYGSWYYPSMMNKVSHTIRFDKEKKQEIIAIGKQNGRGFQAQVDFMLSEQLKNQEVVRFTNSIRCALEDLPKEKRETVMAKIATIVGAFME